MRYQFLLLSLLCVVRFTCANVPFAITSKTTMGQVFATGGAKVAGKVYNISTVVYYPLTGTIVQLNTVTDKPETTYFLTMWVNLPYTVSPGHAVPIYPQTVYYDPDLWKTKQTTPNWPWGVDWKNVANRPCNAPTRTESKRGLTAFDCCVNDVFDTCTFFRTNSTAGLETSPLRCVASYMGMGSVLNTPCERFYHAESPFAIAAKPTTGNVFTDYGAQHREPEIDCYIENWSKYRTFEHGVPYNYDTHFDSCDRIFYAFYTYESGRLREPHDEKTISAFVSAGKKVIISIGGWNFNATTAVKAFTTNFASTQKFLIDILTSTGAHGYDIDLEFPGVRGLPNLPNIFYDNILAFCEKLQSTGSECHLGGIFVGMGYNTKFFEKFSNIDSVNIFGYDMAGCYDMTKQFAQHQLLNTNDTKWSIEQQLINAKQLYPASKLSVGIPIYARGYFNPSDGTTGACFPPQSESALAEDGIDTLVIHNGKIIPSFCSRDPMHSIVESPTGSGQECVGVYSLNGVVGNYRIPFFGESYVKKFVDYTYTQGVRKYFFYAMSMSPSVAAKLRSLLLQRLRALQITTDTVNDAYYSYPATLSVGVSQCPGILYYDSMVVVTAVKYEGCSLVDNTYCFYLRTKFRCATFTKYTQLAKRTTRCDGIDAVSLLPSSKTSRRVYCYSGELFIDGIGVCLTHNNPESRKNFVFYEPGMHSAFTPRNFPVKTEPVVRHAVMTIPKQCEQFVKPYSCLEYICGADSNCLTEFRKSEFFETCYPVTDLLNQYTILLDDVKSLGMRTQHQLSLVLNATAGWQWGTSDTVEHNLLGLFTGLLVGGVVGGLFGSSSGPDYSGQIDAIERNMDRLAERTNEIVGQVNTIRDNQKALAKQVQSIDNKFTTALNKLNHENQLFQAQVQAKFATFTTAIMTLTKQIIAVENKLAASTKLTTAVLKYMAYIINLKMRLTDYFASLSNVNALLSDCAITLQRGSFDGCVIDSDTKYPLSVVMDTIDGDTSLIFIYLAQTTTAVMNYRATKSYCQNGKMFVSAENCLFVMINKTIHHMQPDLNHCDSAYHTFHSPCNTYTVNVTNNAPPRGHYIQDVSPSDLYDLNATVNANLTGVLRDIFRLKEDVNVYTNTVLTLTDPNVTAGIVSTIDAMSNLDIVKLEPLPGISWSMTGNSMILYILFAICVCMNIGVIIYLTYDHRRHEKTKLL